MWNWIVKQSGYVGQELDSFGKHIIDVFTSGNMVEIGKFVVLYQQAFAPIGVFIAGVATLCAVIPVVGWIAIGILAGVALQVSAMYMVSRSKGKGFRLGVEVSTGWFGIPTGIRFVCG